MPRKGYTPEQIINKLREAEVLIGQGSTISIVCKKIGASDYTYYRWRKEYGGMRVDQALGRKAPNISKESEMKYSTSLFSQILQIILRSPVLRLVYDNKTERHAKGFSSWDQ